MKKSSSFSDVNDKVNQVTDPENLEDFRECLGGAWEFSCVSLSGERRLILDVSKITLPDFTFAELKIEYPSIALPYQRKLPRGIQKNETSNFNVLPHVLHMMIFAQLPVQDVGRCMRACNEWNELLNLNDLWCHLLERDFNDPGNYCDAKSIYKKQSAISPITIHDRIFSDTRDLLLRFGNIFQNNAVDINFRDDIFRPEYPVNYQRARFFIPVNPLLEAPQFQLNLQQQELIQRAGAAAVQRYALEADGDNEVIEEADANPSTQMM